MITAMLNWYDEDQITLRRVCGDVARLGATKLVAVDGAYENFKGRVGANSNPYQREDLEDAALANGLDLISYVPQTKWVGDEVAKRQVMLDLALAVTPADGWLLVYDADYELINLNVDVPELLASTVEDAVDITFTTSPEMPEGDHHFRMFLRATAGLRMGTNHYTYLYPDGRHSVVMVGGSTIEGPWVKGVRVFHRHYLRDAARHQAQTDYYEIRDTQKLETP